MYILPLALLVAVLQVPTRVDTNSTGGVDAVHSAAPRAVVSPPLRPAPVFPLRLPAGGAQEPPRVTSLQPVEYSDWYGRRLTIHRWASYATLPLFAFQYAAGRELYEKSNDAPAWAREGHGVAATGIVALFGVNTVTGVWNLWEARKDPEGRKTRTAHAVMMLVADAGFAATGLLAERAERSADDRRLHRTMAISSMSVATVSYLIMLPPFRRD